MFRSQFSRSSLTFLVETGRLLKDCLWVLVMVMAVAVAVEVVLAECRWRRLAAAAARVWPAHAAHSLP